MGLTNDPRELTNELDPVLDRPMSGELTNELGNPVTNDPGTDQRPGNLQVVKKLSPPPSRKPNTLPLVEALRVGVWSSYFMWMQYLIVLEVGRI